MAEPTTKAGRAALGEAVERLQAALPEDWRVTFAWNPRQERWGVQARASKGRVRFGAGAPTIAEAADKVRVAIAAALGDRS